MTTIYQIQARDSRNHWDSENVSPDTDATDFATLEAAEAMVEELIELGGRDRDTLRIREVLA